MTRLYKQAARGTRADEPDKQAGTRPAADNLLYRLDLQRQVAPGNERTFGQWAIQALLDNDDGTAPEASKQDESPEAAGNPTPPRRRRVFIVSANDEYNFCAWCGHRIPDTARVRHSRASNTTIIECPHCRRELEYILK